MLLDLYSDRVDQAAVTADGFLPTRPRGFGLDTLVAGFDAATAPDEWGRSTMYRRKQYDEAVAAYEKATGQKLVSPSLYEMDRGRAIKDFGVSGPGLSEAIDQYRAQVDQTLADAHDIYPDVPNPADFDQAIAEESVRRRDREALMSSTSSVPGSIGLFLGSAAGEMTHPVQVMTLPFGGTGGAAAKSTLGKLATSAAEQSAIAAGTQTALEVGDYYSRKRFGTAVGLDEAAFNILTAAAGGAILDTALKTAPVVFGAGARAVAASGRSVLDRFARAPRAGRDAVNVAESDAFVVASNPGRPTHIVGHAETLDKAVTSVDGLSTGGGAAGPSYGRASRTPPAAADFPAIARVRQGNVPGGPSVGNRVFTASGRGVDVAYEVVEARSLVTSHGPDMQDNPAFPAELQPRDRTRAASQTQIAEIAARLEPQRLGAGSDAATGAPIVGPDNVVESGNGRVLALQQAFRRFPEKAREYRQFLEAQGFDAGDMAEPVLVRRRVMGLTPEARIAFTREANEATIMAMGAGEQALSDAKRTPNGILELYRGGDLALVRNRGFVRKLVDALPVAERAAMITADGELSQAGVKRLEAALLAKAYGDANLIAKLTESTDNDIRAIGKALTEAAPAWAQMRARAAAGEIAPGMDATADLLSAVRVVERARQDSMTVGDLLRQGQMFGDGLTEPAYGFLRAMFRDSEMSRPAAQSVVTERLGQFIEEANKTLPGPDMFGNAPVAASEVLGVRPVAQIAPERIPEPTGPAQSAAAAENLTQSAVDTELARLLEAQDFEVPVEVVEVDGTRQIQTRSARELVKEADAGIRAARQVGLCAVGLVKGAAE